MKKGLSDREVHFLLTFVELTDLTHFSQGKFL